MDSKTYRQLVSTMLFLFFTSAAISAQTTEFNYQGTLKDGANVANGNFDFEFRIFDDVSAGTQIGSLLTRANVVVANGIFSVKLDFANPFNGADRFLEIRVRNAGGTGYTVLDPRQRIGSSPYAVKSLLAETANNANSAATANNALQLGGVAANQYVVTTDPRMTDPRTPTAEPEPEIKPIAKVAPPPEPVAQPEGPDPSIAVAKEKARIQKEKQMEQDRLELEKRQKDALKAKKLPFRLSL